MKIIILALLFMAISAVANADTQVGSQWDYPAASSFNKLYPGSLEFRVDGDNLKFRFHSIFGNKPKNFSEAVFHEIEQSKARFLAAFAQIEKWNESAYKIQEPFIRRATLKGKNKTLIFEFISSQYSRSLTINLKKPKDISDLDHFSRAAILTTEQSTHKGKITAALSHLKSVLEHSLSDAIEEDPLSKKRDHEKEREKNEIRRNLNDSKEF